MSRESYRKGDLGKHIAAWSVEHPKAVVTSIVGTVSAIVLVVVFTLTIRDNAAAGAALAPRLEMVERDVAAAKQHLSTLDEVLDDMKVDIRDLRVFFLGPPPTAPTPAKDAP